MDAERIIIQPGKRAEINLRVGGSSSSIHINGPATISIVADESVSLSQHIGHLRAHELIRWDEFSGEEKAARWERRQVYLRDEYVRLESKLPEVIQRLDSCPVCEGPEPVSHSWPALYRCSRCGAKFVIDMPSHLCPDEVRRICIVWLSASMPNTLAQDTKPTK